jgi:flavin-dependent dehydrogenase
MFDVLIAGAGPAGSTAAIVLARAGARVLVLDRARFPRPKLCGDTVNPGALTILRRLRLDLAVAGGLPIEGMLVTALPDVKVIGRYDAGVEGRSVPRRDLDFSLVRSAVDAGAWVEEGVLVRGPLADDGRVRGLMIAGRGGRSLRVTAPLVIAADGGPSRIARSLSLSRSAARPRRWAVGGYFENVAGLSRLGEMHVRRGHYIGVAPLPDGTTNACIVTGDRMALRQPGALLERALRSDALLRERFAAARLVAPPVCLGPLAVENHASGVPGLLLAGDAAGFIDPMTGDGLRFAFRGGELAALEAIAMLQHGDADAHARLDAARRREFRRKWYFNRLLRRLVSMPTAVRASATAAALAPAWLRCAIRYAGDVNRVRSS